MTDPTKRLLSRHTPEVRDSALRCATVAENKSRTTHEACIRCYIGGFRAASAKRKCDAERIRDAFVRWHMAHGTVPSAKDMAAETGIRLKDVQAHLAMMRKRAREDV